MAIARIITHDVAAERAARARMAELDMRIAAGEEGLQAERDTLDGSWLIEEFIDLPDALDEDQAAAAQVEIDRAAWNETIKAQLAENDAKALRALIEGDQERISAHAATQAALRAQLR